jgi:hypothetical protein
MFYETRLNDLFPNWLTTGGIFAAIADITEYTMPWAATVAETTLDIQYHGNHSGRKYISPLVTSLVDWTTDPPSIDSADIAILATVIKSMFSTNWTNLWNRFTTVYDPLINYDIKEELTKTDTNTGTVTDAGTVGHGQITTTVSENDATGEANVFGFNSATAVPSDTTTVSNDSTITATNSGTDTTGNTTTNDLMSESESTLRRYGDMSVRSTQDILNGEFKLWQIKFFDIVFSDVDSVLTTQVY